MECDMVLLEDEESPMFMLDMSWSILCGVVGSSSGLEEVFSAVCFEVYARESFVYRTSTRAQQGTVKLVVVMKLVGAIV